MKPYNCTEYVMIAGKVYPVDTEEQRKTASRVLSGAGINATRVWRNGFSTVHLLLADTNVDPLENGS